MLTAGSAISRSRNGLSNHGIVKEHSYTSSADIVDRQHGFFAPGYVFTSHASQGKTYDKVIVSETAESLAANREQFYVSVSRGSNQAMIFTDDKSTLREAVARSSSRLAATELVKHFPFVVGPQRRKQPELAHERA